MLLAFAVPCGIGAAKRGHVAQVEALSGACPHGVGYGEEEPRRAATRYDASGVSRAAGRAAATKLCWTSEIRCLPAADSKIMKNGAPEGERDE